MDDLTFFAVDLPLSFVVLIEFASLKEVLSAARGTDVLHADVQPLGPVPVPDLLLEQYTDCPLRDVPDHARFAVVYSVCHTLLNGRVHNDGHVITQFVRLQDPRGFGHSRVALLEHMARFGPVTSMVRHGGGAGLNDTQVLIAMWCQINGRSLLPAAERRNDDGLEDVFSLFFTRKS